MKQTFTYRFLLFGVIMLAALLVRPVFAAELSVEVDSEPRSGVGIFQNVSEDDTVQLVVGSGRSYCCTLTSTPEGVSFTGITNTAVEGIDTSADYPPVESGSRMCFVMKSQTGFAGPVAWVNLELSLGGAESADITVSCTETTLYGSYNTMASDIAYLEIRKISPSAHTGLTAYEFVVRSSSWPGQPVYMPSQTIVFGSMDRFDIAVNHGWTSNSYGTVRLGHDGAPGTLQADIAEYNFDPITGSPSIKDRQPMKLRSAK